MACKRNRKLKVAGKLTHSHHGDKPFLRNLQLCSYSRISQHFMEPEGSLPCSQEPSTGPYPLPDQSGLDHPILSLSLIIIIIIIFQLEDWVATSPF
jgi:hypothetical protein